MRFDFMPNTDTTVFLTYTEWDGSARYWGGCKVCGHVEELTKREAGDWPERCESCEEDRYEAEQCAGYEIDNAADYAEAVEVASERFYRA